MVNLRYSLFVTFEEDCLGGGGQLLFQFGLVVVFFKTRPNCVPQTGLILLLGVQHWHQVLFLNSLGCLPLVGGVPAPSIFREETQFVM